MTLHNEMDETTNYWLVVPVNRIFIYSKKHFLFGRFMALLYILFEIIKLLFIFLVFSQFFKLSNQWAIIITFISYAIYFYKIILPKSYRTHVNLSLNIYTQSRKNGKNHQDSIYEMISIISETDYYQTIINLYTKQIKDKFLHLNELSELTELYTTIMVRFILFAQKGNFTYRQTKKESQIVSKYFFKIVKKYNTSSAVKNTNIEILNERVVKEFLINVKRYAIYL